MMNLNIAGKRRRYNDSEVDHDVNTIAEKMRIGYGAEDEDYKKKDGASGY
jgi:hypothetical protein